jgi:digeranylgeranylglycerophospholipid reductase
MKSQYDIVVVGGGPAGLSAAYAAASGGAEVALFERDKEIGHPVHTSGGSWISDLQALGIPSRYWHPISEGHLVGPTERAVFHYENPVSCILDVRGLYQYLACKAGEAGVETYVDSKVIAPIIEHDIVQGVSLRRGSGTQPVRSRIVIDASGINAIIARRAGLAAPPSRMGIGAEYEVYAPHWPQDRIALLFGDHIAPKGYGWIFPRGAGRVRLGVGVVKPDTPADPRSFLNRFFSDTFVFREQLQDVSQLEYHVGSIPSTPYLRRTYSDGLLVVGDAGGLISTLLGEGIRFAIDIGRIAGGVAAEAIAVGNTSSQFLVSFEKAWQKRYKRLFDIAYRANRRLARYDSEKWDRRIADLRGLDPLVLADLLRGDFSPSALLKLTKRLSIRMSFFTKLIS